MEAALLASALVILQLLQLPTTASAEKLNKTQLWDKKPCRDNRDCDVLHTFMTCTSAGSGYPTLCTCEPFRAGTNNVTQPYYNQEKGQCVIRLGEPCTLNPVAGGWGEYKCEPGARCMWSDRIEQPSQYGRCSGSGLVVSAWIIALGTATVMATATLLKH
jgi:hypothetical protein